MNSGPSQGQTIGYGQSTADQAKTDSLTSQVSQNNAQFNNPPGGSAINTPYGQSLLQSGTQSTNQAYDNAQRNLRSSMEAAGVGGGSGASVGNNAALNAQRASSLGTVGTSAIQGSTQMQQNANAQQLQQAGLYSGAGLGYYSGGNQAEMLQNQQQGSLWNGLLQAGTGLGEAAIMA